MIVLQICLCQGGCDIFNSPPQEISRCREVEEIFEKGLISNKDNLFVLREAFLSNSRPPPNLMLVKYDIFNWTNYTEQLLWSNSRIFTTIHPNLLSAFQSGIMTIIFYFEGLVYTPEITLHIPVSDTSRLAPTSAEIARALSAINEKVNYCNSVLHYSCHVNANINHVASTVHEHTKYPARTKRN